MSDTTFDKTDRSPDNGNMKAKWIALGVIVALILGVAISSTDSDLFQGLMKRKAKSGLTNQRSAINLPTKPSLNLDSSSSGPSTANTAPQDSTTPPPPPALTANTSRNEGVVNTRYALGQREARIASFWVTNAGDRETEDIIVSSIKLQRKGSTIAPEITNFKLSVANVNAVGNRTGTETIIGTVTNSADDRSITWTGVDTVIKPKMGGRLFTVTADIGASCVNDHSIFLEIPISGISVRGAGTGRLAQFPLTVATGTGVALQTNRCNGPASVGATLDSSAPSPEAEVAPGRTSAHIGSLRITAGPNQAIRLRKIDIRNDSSLDLEDVYVENFSATGRPRVGTSVDELDSGRTLSFPQSGGRLDLEVPANSSVTLDIFATIPASCTRFDEIRMSVPASGIKATGRLLGDVVFSSATSLSLQTLNCVSPSFSVEKDTSFSDTIITSSDEGRLPVAGFKIVTDSPAEEIDINSLTFRKTGGLALSEPRLFLVLAGGGTTEMYSTRPEFNGAGEVTFPWTFTITGVGERKFILKAKVQSGCTAGDDALIYVTQDSVLAEGSTSSIDLDAKPDTDLALHAVTCGTTTVPD